METCKYLRDLCLTALGFTLGAGTIVGIDQFYFAPQRAKLEAAYHKLYSDYEKNIEERSKFNQKLEEITNKLGLSLDDKFK